LHPSSGAQLQRTAIGFVWFGVFIPLEQVLVWDSFTVYSYRQDVPNQYLLQCNKHTKPYKKYAAVVLLMMGAKAPETCTTNDERNKEYIVHLVGPE
jgi:hypothetical protein